MGTFPFAGRIAYGRLPKGATVPTLHPTDLAALLYTRYRQKMYAVAFGILHRDADAEDAVADAVVRMLRHIDQFAEPDMDAAEETSPNRPHHDRNEALLCIYARHAAIDILRRRKPDTPLEDAPDVPDPAPLPEDAVVAEEDIEELRRAIDRIKPDFREVILLRYAHDMSIAAIAQALEIHEVTVRTRLLRGKKALYNCLTTRKETIQS